MSDNSSMNSPLSARIQSIEKIKTTFRSVIQKLRLNQTKVKPITNSRNLINAICNQVTTLHYTTAIAINLTSLRPKLESELKKRSRRSSPTEVMLLSRFETKTIGANTDNNSSERIRILCQRRT